MVGLVKTRPRGGSHARVEPSVDAGTSVDIQEDLLEEFLPVIKHPGHKVARGFKDEDFVGDLISADILKRIDSIDEKLETCIRPHRPNG